MTNSMLRLKDKKRKMTLEREYAGRGNIIFQSTKQEKFWLSRSPNERLTWCLGNERGREMWLKYS